MVNLQLRLFPYSGASLPSLLTWFTHTQIFLFTTFLSWMPCHHVPMALGSSYSITKHHSVLQCQVDWCCLGQWPQAKHRYWALQMWLVQNEMHDKCEVQNTVEDLLQTKHRKYIVKNSVWELPLYTIYFIFLFLSTHHRKLKITNRIFITFPQNVFYYSVNSTRVDIVYALFTVIALLSDMH